ncbi:MAG: STAS domain-containing protein [Planctomycetes bacterium]|nr:STAS domain-containing protein [Planctomycetota bacterium]
MAGATDSKHYIVSNGQLLVMKEMLHDQDLLFDEACQQLLSSKSKELLIDLSKSNYINSTYVGIIAATFFQANNRKKKLRLRATSNLVDVLRLAGFEEFIPIEEVSKQAHGRS